MAGNNSIQILRGGSNYDPSKSDEILLDGQPFYSKNTNEFYIGDGESSLKELKGTQIGLNLKNGVAENSIEQVFEVVEKSPKATGYGAVAFGGFRGDKPDEQPTTQVHNEDQGK